MKTFFITSLGCKVNQYESNEISQFLAEQGLTQTDSPCAADIALVHTCCVTHIASAKSRKALRNALKLGSHCYVVATGCLPDAGKTETAGLESQITFISKKENIKDALGRIINHSNLSRTENGNKIKHKKVLNHDKNEKKSNQSAFSDKSDTISQQSRAFLKIQDGCDGLCSYCIIPKIRTNLHSRSEDEIIAEAKQITAAGHKEIVLTGIFLGAYGQSTVKRKFWDNQNRFLELIDNIADIKDLERLRLSSLEPGDLTDELLKLFEKHKTLVPHLHLSLQSGSSRILKKMNRQYDAEQFRQCVIRAKDALDKPALTTDIIVGFPGETDEDFQETIEMAHFAGFAKIHIFSFSRRKGTAADKMQGHLPPEIIKQRSAELSKVEKQLGKDYRKQFAGDKVSVIIENEEKQSGRTERYFEVQLVGTKLNKGDLTYAILNEDCKTAKPLC